jgi:alpha-ketoglutarate-dependent taurine dioxygenase
MATITAQKLDAQVGAVVIGADLDLLLSDADAATWCLDALEHNGVLVFRDLHVDDVAQVAFSSRLGEVEKVGRGQHPEIFRVTLDPAKNPAAAYLKGTFDWHIDGMTDDIPIMATLLSARVVAESGGDTEFASTYLAYERLSEEEQARLRDERVVHTFEAAQRLANNDPSPEELARWRRVPVKEHPLVWQHRSGRRSLVLGATASHVVGMDLEEGRALLADLLARATAPELILRHEWTVGDLVMWDNRGVLHRACPYDTASARDMHRTTLVGDEPVQGVAA